MPTNAQFDSRIDQAVARVTDAPTASGTSAAAWPGASATALSGIAQDMALREDMFLRIGQLTRALHDALRELGYDKTLESAVRTLPDARQRLDYIATLTGRAAERVLGAVERGRVLQEDIDREATALQARWNTSEPGSMELVASTRQFLDAVRRSSRTQNDLLHDIMMAQDFHDLTGQVIKRVGDIACNLESNLIALLVETAPAGAQPLLDVGLQGPVIRPEGRSDVVQDQSEVDSLLESLGF